MLGTHLVPHAWLRNVGQIREAAIRHRIPCITTLAGASAAVQAIAQARDIAPIALQDLHLAAVTDGEHASR